jgi:hypothetical protein
MAKVELANRLANSVVVRRYLGTGDVDSRSLCSDIYNVGMHDGVRLTLIPFMRFLGDVRLEFMQRLSVVLHRTLGSYIWGASLESSYMSTCPAGLHLRVFLLPCLVSSTRVFVIKYLRCCSTSTGASTTRRLSTMQRRRRPPPPELTAATPPTTADDKKTRQ